MPSADTPGAVSTVMTPDHARMVSRLMEQERDEAESRRGRWAVGGQLLSAGLNSVGGLFGALDMAVTAGSLGIAVGAIEAVQILLLREGAERVRKEGRVPDFSASGIGMAARCAEEGARADAFMREQWVRLLTACLDPSRLGEVRISDIELLRTLNPSDAMALLVVGKHKEAITDEWQKSDIIKILAVLKIRIDNEGQERYVQWMPLALILARAETVFGNRIHNRDEISYAFECRTQLLTRSPVDSGPDGPALFHTQASSARVRLLDGIKASKDQYVTLVQGLGSIKGHPQEGWLETLVNVNVMPRAARLVNILYDARSGY